MRIGIFGGTFDPIHQGHLIIAEQCREQARLDEVWFLPSARPPHKARPDLTPLDKRADMIQLAIAGHAQFRASEIEKDRPGPSYTADTLAELRKERPEVDWHLILGSDCLPDLASWHEPLRVVAQAKLVIVARPGWPVWSAEQLRTSLRLREDQALHLQIVSVPLIEIASRDLRRRVAEGRSVRYMVPAPVAACIADKGLYK
jgi:nicotinate-nucleotide adenylyltransferase